MWGRYDSPSVRPSGARGLPLECRPTSPFDKMRGCAALATPAGAAQGRLELKVNDKQGCSWHPTGRLLSAAAEWHSIWVREIKEEHAGGDACAVSAPSFYVIYVPIYCSRDPCRPLQQPDNNRARTVGEAAPPGIWMCGRGQLARPPGGQRRPHSPAPALPSHQF